MTFHPLTFTNLHALRQKLNSLGEFEVIFQPVLCGAFFFFPPVVANPELSTILKKEILGYKSRLLPEPLNSSGKIHADQANT